MVAAVVLNFISLFVLVFNILILARVILTWVAPGSIHPLAQIIVDVTEPILGPIRKLMPGQQMIDFSPLVAFLLMQILQMVAQNLLVG